MAIPVATTRVEIWRRDPVVTPTRDPWEDGYPDEPSTGNDYVRVDGTADGVRAVISVGGGTYAGRTVGPGDAESVSFTLSADPCDLDYLDRVRDAVTGQWYEVEWTVPVAGVGGILASVTAGIKSRKGT